MYLLKGIAKQFCNGRHQDSFHEIGNLYMYAVTEFTEVSVNLDHKMEPTTSGLKCKKRRRRKIA